MLSSALARTVDFCFRHALAVICIVAIAAVASGGYAARHFAINTDLNSLISSHLPWRQRELAYQTAFPQSTQSILAVIRGSTPELAAAGERAVAKELANQSNHFRSVVALGNGDFFERNSLLYLPIGSLRDTLQKLDAATPLIQAVATDADLRGLTGC